MIDGGAHHNTVGHLGTQNLEMEQVIAGNKGPGVVISGQGTNNNILINNYIGAVPKSLGLPPGAVGNSIGVVVEQGAASNTVGPENVIAFNKQGGVVFNPFMPPGRNVVTKSSIYDNQNKGIWNSRTAPPVLTFVTLNQVEGTTSPKCSGCVVEVFANPALPKGYPAQGKTWLGTITTQSDGAWQWTGTVPMLNWVTATVTDNGDTSEFSKPKRATAYFAAIVKTLEQAEPICCVSFELKASDTWPFPLARTGSDDVTMELTDEDTGGWDVDRAQSESDGGFMLADNQSETLALAYRLLLADPRYRVASADSASGGEVLPDGSIVFTPVEPRLFEENTFFVEEVPPQEWVVNTTADHDDGRCDPLEAGDCTLREAINAANDGDGPDVILFDMSESDPGFRDDQWIIQPETALPELTGDGLMIDAGPTRDGETNSSPSICTGDLFIVVDGGLAPPGTSGYTLTGVGQQVSGMVISHWPAYGVRIASTTAPAHDNVVACNKIVDNAGDGVRIETAAHHNTVGGPPGGNLISGNTGDGVRIAGIGADHNRVIGNYVGIDEAGASARANTGHGVHIAGGAQFNDVGGELAEDGNVIAGNAHTGVMIEGSNTDLNRVGANLIGTAANGSTPLGNGNHGVGIYSGAGLNQVGSSVLQPNLIGASAWSGVAVVESNANTIFGNYVGTDASGVKKLGNSYYGVHVVGGFDNSVSSNTITHNGADGGRVEGSAAVRNRITVNSITANGGKGIELLNGGNTEAGTAGHHQRGGRHCHWHGVRRLHGRGLLRMGRTRGSTSTHRPMRSPTSAATGRGVAPSPART